MTYYNYMNHNYTYLNVFKINCKRLPYKLIVTLVYIKLSVIRVKIILIV